MTSTKNSALGGITGAICLAMISLVGAGTAWAQSEKRTVFAPDDFHWQGHLKAGQTLEVINRNGEIDASAAAGDEARDRKSGVEGKSVDLGGRRIIKKKK